MPNERIHMSKFVAADRVADERIEDTARWRAPVGLSIGAVSMYLRAARAAGISAAEAESLPETDVSCVWPGLRRDDDACASGARLCVDPQRARIRRAS